MGGVRRVLGERPGGPWEKGDLTRERPHYQHFQESIPWSADWGTAVAGMPRGEMGGRPSFTQDLQGVSACPPLFSLEWRVD